MHVDDYKGLRQAEASGQAGDLEHWLRVSQRGGKGTPSCGTTRYWGEVRQGALPWVRGVGVERAWVWGKFWPF